AIRNAYSSAVVRPRMPITGRVCCALGGCVQRIDAAAAPPRAKMNSRLFIRSPRQRGREVSAARREIDDQHEFRRGLNGNFGQTTSCLMLRYLIWRRILEN